jgi:hypothetical protein
MRKKNRKYHKIQTRKDYAMGEIVVALAMVLHTKEDPT